MRRPQWSHRLVFTLCALTVGLILGGYLFHRIRETTRHLDRLLVQQLETQLGRAVRSGPVTVTRSGRFTIRNLRIADGDSFDDGLFLRVDRVDGQLNLPSLLFRRAEPVRALESIHLVRPRLFLTRNRKGTWNYQELIKPKKPGAKPVYFAGTARLTGGEVSVRDFRADLPPRALPAQNRLVELNGTVDARGMGGLTPSYGIDFRLSGRGERRLGPVTASGRYNPVQLSGNVTTSVKSVDLAYWANYLTPPQKAYGIRAGRVDVNGTFRIRKGKLDPASLVATASLTGGEVSLAALRAPLRGIRVRAQSRGSALQLTGSANLENIPLTLSGRVPDLQKPIVDATLTAGAFAAERLPLLVTALRPAQWPGLTGMVRGSARAKGPPNDLRIAAQFTSPRLAHPKAVAQGVVGTVTYANGLVEGTLRAQQSFGGSLNVTGTYRLDRPSHPWTATGRFAGINVGAVAPPTLPDVNGRASGTFAVRGSGRTVGGQAEVTMPAGSVGPLAFRGGTATASSTDGNRWRVRATVASGRMRQFQFRSLEANALASREGVTIDRASAAMWGGRIGVSGRVTQQNALNLAVNASGVQAARALADLGQTVMTGTAAFEGRVTGTVRSPVVAGQLVARQGQIQGVPYTRLAAQFRATQQRIALQDVALRAAGGTLTANGDIALRRGGIGSLNVTSQFRNLPVRLISRLNPEAKGFSIPADFHNALVSGSVRATGSPANLNLALSNVRAAVAGGTVAVNGTHSLRRQGGVSNLSVALNRVPARVVSGLNVGGRNVALSGDLRNALVSGGIRATGTLPNLNLALENVRAAVAGGSVAINGTLSLRRRGGASNLTVALNQVPAHVVQDARWGGRPLFALPALAQAARVTGTAQVSGPLNNLKGSGTARLGPLRIPALQGETVVVQSAEGRVTLAGRQLTLQDLVVRGMGQTLTGSGQVTLGGPVQLQFAGNQIPMEMLQPYIGTFARLTGEGNVTVQVGGKPGALTITLQMETGPLVANRVRFDRVAGSARWDGTRIHLEDMTLQRGDGTFQIPEGRYHLAQRRLHMDLLATHFDVGPLLDVIENSPFLRTSAGERAERILNQVPLPRRGIVDGRMTLDGPLNDLTASINMTGEGVASGQAVLDRVALEATWSPRAMQVTRLEASAPGLNITGSGGLSNAQPVDFTARLSRTDIQALIRFLDAVPSLRRTRTSQRILQYANVLQEPITGLFDATLTLTGSMEEPQGQLVFNIDNLKVGPQVFDLAAGTLDIRGRRIYVEDLQMRGGEANISVTGSGGFTGDLNFDLDVSNLNVQLLTPWLGLPPDVTGTIDEISVLVRGTRDEPQMTASLLATNIGVRRGRAPFLLDRIEATGVRADGDRLTIESLTLTEKAPAPATVDLRTVVHGSLPFSFSPVGIPREGTLDLHADFQEQNLALLQVLTPEVKEAAGIFNGRVDVTGTVARPLVQGSLQVRDGDLLLTRFENRFTQVNGALTFTQERRAELQFSAASSEGGSFTLAGGVALEKFPQGSVNLTLRTPEGQDLVLVGDNVSGIAGEEFRGRLDVDLTLTGPLAKPTLRGSVLAYQTNLSVPETMPTASTPTPRLPLPNVVFDHVKLVAGRDFFVRRGSFQGEIGGALDVTGTALDPSAEGRFIIDNARVRVATKTFRVVDGSSVDVFYRAPGPARIRMDVEATTRVTSYSEFDRERSTYLVTIEMTGPLDNPDIDFHSDPPDLSRQQILAALGYQAQIQALLRGGSDGDQAFRQGIAEAFTGVVAPALFEPLEFAVMRALGLEDFAITYDFQSPLQLQITKQLWGKFYITYRRQLTGVGEDYMFKLYYRLTPRINIGYTTDERNINTFLIEGRLRF